jgi:hypothetical protein
MSLTFPWLCFEFWPKVGLNLKVCFANQNLQSNLHRNMATNGLVCMIEHAKWIGRT